jgi:hypothetical protein
METSNSPQQHQHHMFEELLALFHQETASCYQPVDYLAYPTAAVSEVAETETTGPDVVSTDISIVDAGVRRRQEYVTMRQKMGEWAYDGKYCTTVYESTGCACAADYSIFCQHHGECSTFSTV